MSGGSSVSNLPCTLSNNNVLHHVTSSSCRTLALRCRSLSNVYCTRPHVSPAPSCLLLYTGPQWGVSSLHLRGKEYCLRRMHFMTNTRGGDMEL